MEVLRLNPEDAEVIHQKEAYSLQEIMYNPKVVCSILFRMLTVMEGCLSVTERDVPGYVVRHQ